MNHNRTRQITQKITYVLHTNIREKERTEPKPVQTRNRRADRLHPTMRIDAPASTLAALASLVRLRVHARRHEDVVARGRLDRVRGLLERLAGYDAVDV